jgi:hypothetical protein
MMMIFTSHAYNVEGTVTGTVYLKKKAAAFETLYVCEVNIWTMEKVQRYFSDVSSAPLPRNVITRKHFSREQFVLVVVVQFITKCHTHCYLARFRRFFRYL